MLRQSVRAWVGVTGLAMMAAVAQAETAATDAIKLVWHAPGYVYPVLGWRMPVDLPDSDWRVDRALEAVEPQRYNCHFYTRLHLVERNTPSQLLRWLKQPTCDAITPQCLRAAGLRPLEAGEPARPGDVVVAVRVDARGETVYNHSAIVREVDEAGGIVRIRQKFDDQRPVVDVALSEFRTLYAGLYPYRTEVWGWSLGPRSQVASR